MSDEKHASAFPTLNTSRDPFNGGVQDLSVLGGLSKREYFACAAMQAQMSNNRACEMRYELLLKVKANAKVQPLLDKIKRLESRGISDMQHRIAKLESALRGCIRVLERDAACSCDDTFEGDCNSCQSEIAASEAREALNE